MNEKMVKLAMGYLTRGWSVLPCGKNKIPLIPWKIYQERFPTEIEIKSWFIKFPEAQVGIITGPISNLLVVDVEKGGDTSFLPQNTMIVKTGGQGFHYLFLFEEGFTNKARIRPLTDLRGSGGFIVAAGSTSDKGSYEIIKDLPLLPFPKELFPEKVNIFQHQEIATSNTTIQNYELDYPGYGEGQRNDQTARFIGKVLTKVHPSDWETIAWPIVESANTRNTPPLAQNELRRTFESIKGTEKRNSPYRWLKNDSGGEFPAPQGFSEQPQVLGEQGDEVKHIAEVAESQKIDITDVYSLQMPIFDEVIRGGVIPGDLVVVSGQTSHGKSSLCQDWTMSLIRSEKKVKVLWFSYELMVSEIWRKFQEMGATKEDMVFAPAKHSTGSLDWVEKKIKEAKEKFGIKAVVIDHLGFLLPKIKKGMSEKSMSSNYATYLTQIVREIKTMALQEEIIVFLPVHMKKKERRSDGADIEDLKDSSGIGQEADLVFLIEREKNNNKEADSCFTELTKIYLAKNRRTGITKIGRFTMMNGRFVQDTSDKEFKALTEKKIEAPKVEEKKEQVQKEIPIPYYNQDVFKKDEDEITKKDIDVWYNL
ncbi:MAG: bifunctional DNA primase/polymerase [Patescibacteria group bacterium]